MTLFQKAREYKGGLFEPRLVARMETEHRELTDKELLSELNYWIETIPFAGWSDNGKDEKEYVNACKAFKRKYFA